MTYTDFGSPMIIRRNGIAKCLIGASSFTIYSPIKNYFANVGTAGGKFRHWLNRVFRDNFQ